MFDPGGSGEGKPVRSLLSLAKRQERPAVRPAAPSLVAYATAGSGAQAMHRAARSRREAQPDSILAAPIMQPEEAVRPQNIEQNARHGAWREDETPEHSDLQPAADREGGGGQSDEQWKPLIDPAKIIGGIVKSRYLILSTTVIGAVLGVLIAMSTPKTYTSATDIQIDPRDIKVFDRNLTEGGLPSDATQAIVENQVRVIASGTVIDKVVEQLNLEADPEFNGSQKSFGISSLIGELRSIVSRSEPSAGGRRAALAKQTVYEGLRVERAGKTFIVSISMTTQDRQKSALIANTIANVFMTSYAGLQSDTAGKASEELTGRLVELQKEVEAAERKVEAFQAEHELIDAKGGLISDDELIRLNDQLTIAKARTLELNARASTARELDLNSVVGGGLPEQITSPVISDLRAQYSTAQQALDRAAVRLGPRHPQRQSAEAEVIGIRDQISAELRRLVSSIQVDLKRAVQLEQDLAIRFAQLKAKQGNVGESLVDLRELEREASAKRAVYENFLLRARETGEQSGINTANVSVISLAQPPLDSNGPSRAFISIVGLMLGFLAGVGLGILRGVWDSLRAPNPEGTRPPQVPARSRLRKSGGDPEQSFGFAAPFREDQWQRVIAQEIARSAPSSPSRNPVTEPPVAQAEPQPARQEPPVQPVQAAPAPQQTPLATHQNWATQPAMPQQAVQQPVMAQPVMMPQPPVYAHPQMMQAWPQMMPPAYAPQPYMPPQPMVYAQPPYPYVQPYAAPPQYAPQPFQPVQAAAQASQSATSLDLASMNAVDEIRGSLREFREAVRNLAETRLRTVR